MIWLGALLSLTIFAKPLDQIEILKIAAARSAAEIASLRAQVADLRTTRLACRVQLREGLVPTSCYQALALERRFGLPIGPQAERRLDRACERNSQQLSRPVSEPLDKLSRSCRLSVLRAHELLAYKLDDP